MFVPAILVVLTANPYLADGQRHFEALEFAAATTSLRVAVAQPDLTRDERRRAFDLLAQSLMALDRRDDAEQAYEELLKADPLAATPEASPKVVEAFLRAKQRAWPRPSVSLKQATASDEREVAVAVVDPWALVASLRCFERAEGKLLDATPSRRGEVWSLRPREASERVLFDALDASGVLLAHLDVAAPRVASAPPAAQAGTVAAPRWPAILLTSGAGVATAVGGVMLGVGYRAAPPLTTAGDINAWNNSTTAEAVAGWSLLISGVALGIGSVLAWNF